MAVAPSVLYLCIASLQAFIHYGECNRKQRTELRFNMLTLECTTVGYSHHYCLKHLLSRPSTSPLGKK